MSPNIKFEISPTESLMEHFEGSSPNGYPSLFDGMNPSVDGSEFDYGEYEQFENLNDNDSITSAPVGTPLPQQPEKKVVKKRKSWGQQLPEPKTNLPPRKRAKTEDEKEQRRVERVLRNRRAAQSSRERKRQEVEALESEKVAIERRNRDLELRLAEAEARNLALEQQLLRLSSSSSPYLSPKSSHAGSSPRQMTFSQPLFPSSDSPTPFSQPQTVNPASLSPSIRPVSETSESSSARAPDVTQHSAAVLWDLQCPSATHRPWTLLALLLSLISLTTSRILTTPPPTSSTTSSPSPTASLWTSLISTLLTPEPRTTTTPAPATRLATSASTTSSSPPTTPSTPRSCLRSADLRRLLSCSPHLARPLMDATMGAMRLLSERSRASIVGPGGVAAELEAREGPSMEALAGLLWATHVFSQEIQNEKTDGGVEEVKDVEMGGQVQQTPSARQLESLQRSGGFAVAKKEYRL